MVVEGRIQPGDFAIAGDTDLRFVEANDRMRAAMHFEIAGLIQAVPKGKPQEMK